MIFFDGLKRWTLWLCGWLIVGLVVTTLLGLTPLGRDNSDAGAWGARSGMEPMTDALTGCQYLRVPGGGITPRMDGNGKQVGCRH